MIDIMETHSPAAPNPDTALPKMRKLTESDTAQNRLPISNIAIETRKTGFAGAIARIRPKKSIKAA
jgi:hypothetical protein